MPKVMRGARLSPRHKLAGARPHHHFQTPTPPQWLWLGPKAILLGERERRRLRNRRRSVQQSLSSAGDFHSRR